MEPEGVLAGTERENWDLRFPCPSVWRAMSSAYVTTCILRTNNNNNSNNNSITLVRERTIPTERLRLSVKLVPTSVDRGCLVVNAADPYRSNLDFLDRSRYFFFKVAPQLYSRGWVGPVPDPLLVRKSGSPGNRSRTSGSVARNSDH
jgi:hypothetical protein